MQSIYAGVHRSVMALIKHPQAQLLCLHAHAHKGQGGNQAVLAGSGPKPHNFTHRFSSQLEGKPCLSNVAHTYRQPRTMQVVNLLEPGCKPQNAAANKV